MAEATRGAFAALRALEAELASERAARRRGAGRGRFRAPRAARNSTRLAVKPGEEEALAERRQRHDAGRKGRRRYPRRAAEPLGRLLGDAAADRRRAPPRAATAAGAGADRALREGARCRARGARSGDRRGGGRPRRRRFRSQRARAGRGAAVRPARHGAQICDAGRPACRRSPRNTRPISRRSTPAQARLAALERRRAEAVGAYFGARPALSKARAASARDLEKAVNAELPPLKLERARFLAQIADRHALVAADGFDRIEFCGADQSRLARRAADEGRLGRRTCAFHARAESGARRRGSAPTLVFDEIDTGVGGAVADAIGQRLARLAAQRAGARRHPCAAGGGARRRSHFRIAKSDVGAASGWRPGLPRSTRRARREEIARMLAGATITEEARAAAKRLIENAG